MAYEATCKKFIKNLNLIGISSNFLHNYENIYVPEKFIIMEDCLKPFFTKFGQKPKANIVV